MKIKNWMNRNVKTVTKEISIFKVAQQMKDHFIASMVVVNNGVPIGIITERDICYKVVALGKDPTKATVDDIMTKSLITAHMDDTISEVSRRMGLAKIKQIPIVDNNKTLVGIISSTDLVRVVSHFQKDLHNIVGVGNT